MTAASLSKSNPLVLPALLKTQAKGQVWVQALTVLWLASTFAIFPGNGLLLYPLTLIFIALAVVERAQVFPLLLKSWFLFSVPVFSLISVGWSDYPAAGLQLSAFLILTVFMMVVVAALLTERQIIRCFFFCAIFGTALAIPEYATIATQGSEYLGAKNFYGMKMMISMVVAYAVAANPKEPLPLRLAAAVLIPIDFFLVVVANSVTMLALAGVSLLLLVMLQIFWVKAAALGGMRSVFVLVILAAMLVVGISFLNADSSSFANQILTSLGKDTTLTGRTDLWEQALLTHQENPWFGVGAAGFWQYDTGAAQTLVENLNMKPGTALGFHNSYLEVLVHLGLVGLTIFILFNLWCVAKNVQGIIRESTFERATFLVAAFIPISVSFTESILWSFLNPMIYLFLLGPLTLLASDLRKKIVYVKVTEDQTGSD
ncbi:MAG: O-antigen ligase family protein [Pseudomonadota bacterium]